MNLHGFLHTSTGVDLTHSAVFFQTIIFPFAGFQGVLYQAGS